MMQRMMLVLREDKTTAHTLDTLQMNRCVAVVRWDEVPLLECFTVTYQHLPYKGAPELVSAVSEREKATAKTVKTGVLGGSVEQVLHTASSDKQ